MNNRKKRICFVITSRVHYARNKALMNIINQDPDFRMQIIVGGSALLTKYGQVLDDMMIGGQYIGNYNGLIDDVRIYNYALSQNEVAELL